MVGQGCVWKNLTTRCQGNDKCPQHAESFYRKGRLNPLAEGEGKRQEVTGQQGDGGVVVRAGCQMREQNPPAAARGWPERAVVLVKLGNT